MPRPIPLRLVLKTLIKNLFFLVRQKGSHARYEKTVNQKTFKVTVNVSKKEIPHGTFQSILLQSGLKESDFREKN
ncbi:type II toxin-antitoxin system HicA family toxin [Candidatus Azambacteria bacterium]|nr:type II toxin-antitoxin system HicA family toxin [Candidatus Azambacteria bacterium]